MPKRDCRREFLTGWHSEKDIPTDRLEDYEDSLTGEQRKERERVLTGYRQAYEKIMKDE